MSLPERNYLEDKVMPALMQALEKAALEKPTSPLEFIAHFMLK